MWRDEAYLLDILWSALWQLVEEKDIGVEKEMAINPEERLEEPTPAKSETAADGFSRSARSWQVLIDPEKLISELMPPAGSEMPPCPKCLRYEFDHPLKAWEKDPDGLCLLHSHVEDKDQDGAFTALVEMKKDQKDYNFAGVYFPGDVSFKEIEFTKDSIFKETIFSGKTDFYSVTFSEKSDFEGALF